MLQSLSNCLESPSESPYGNVILHLTDLHFGFEGNPAARAGRQKVLDDLNQLLASQPNEWQPTVICVTGDIVDRGNAQGYQAAAAWLRSLTDCLNLSVDRVVICPGNHDLSRDRLKPLTMPQTPEGADKALDIHSADEPIFSAWRSPFQDFEKFCSDFGIPPVYLGAYPNHLVGCRNLCGIRFICMNSAWFCVGKNEQLYLGLPQLKYMLDSKQISCTTDDREDVTVALVHHPGECLALSESTSRSRTAPYPLLKQCCRLVLSGHTHPRTAYGDPEHAKCHMLIGGAMHDEESYSHSIQLIRIKENQFQVRCFEGCTKHAPNYWKETEPKPCNRNYGYDVFIDYALSQGHTPKRLVDRFRGQDVSAPTSFPASQSYDGVVRSHSNAILTGSEPTNDAVPAVAATISVFQAMQQAILSVAESCRTTGFEETLRQMEAEKRDVLPEVVRRAALIDRALQVRDTSRAATIAAELEVLLESDHNLAGRKEVYEIVARAYLEHALTNAGGQRDVWLAKAHLAIEEGSRNG